MVQTVAIQYAAQKIEPFFNSTFIIESTSGDASILGNAIISYNL